MSDIITIGSSGKTGTFSQIFDKSRRDPVGTIRQSILTEPQFQAKAGNGWIRIDGRSLAVASYPELFGFVGYTYGGAGANFNIPNMIDRYSRMSGTYSLGTCQSNTTALNGLNVISGVYCTQYVFGGGWADTGFITGAPPNHQHSAGNGSISLRYRNGHMYWKTCALQSFTSDTCISTSATNYIPTTQGSFTGQGMCISGNTGLANNSNGLNTIGASITPIFISGSDPETRPETIVLNWFIKIK
jgi:microcystin-dependent protein